MPPKKINLTKHNKKSPKGKGYGRGQKVVEGPYSRALVMEENVPDVRPPNTAAGASMATVEENTTEVRPPNIDVPAGMATLEENILDGDDNGVETTRAEDDMNRLNAEANANIESIIELDDSNEDSICPVEKVGEDKDSSQGQNLEPRVPHHNSNPSNILEHSTLSPNAQVFVPRVNDPNHVMPVAAPTEDEPSIDLEAMGRDIEETIQFCSQRIKEHPGSFDEVMEIVETHLVDALGLPQLHETLINSIFRIVENDEYFAFGAVKIINTLVCMDMNVYQSVEFRTRVLTVARSQSLACKIKLNRDGTLMAVLLYLSELYMQLDIGTGRLLLIAAGVIEILIKLVNDTQMTFADRVNFIYKVVKLIGSALDCDDRGVLDELLERVRMAIPVGELPRVTAYQLEFMHRQREEGWPDNTGMVTIQYPNPPPQVAEAAGYGDYEAQQYGAAYYAPDGRVLTQEEQEFLDECETSDEASGSSEMDPDMAVAFQQFLVYSGQVEEIEE